MTLFYETVRFFPRNLPRTCALCPLRQKHKLTTPDPVLTTVFMVISFEGIDGCGKSTQVQLLDERLQRLGCKTVVLREPGTTPIAEAIRTLLLDARNAAMTHRTELLLFSAARAQVVELAIRPALASGAIVICDRFADSTFAYQGFGRGIDVEDIARCTAVATAGLKPDVTLFLDVPLAEAKARSSEKHLDRMESAGDDFFERAISIWFTTSRSASVALMPCSCQRICTLRFGSRFRSGFQRGFRCRIQGKLREKLLVKLLVELNY
jgi:dTMP kinase